MRLKIDFICHAHSDQTLISRPRDLLAAVAVVVNQKDPTNEFEFAIIIQTSVFG